MQDIEQGSAGTRVQDSAQVKPFARATSRHVELSRRGFSASLLALSLSGACAAPLPFVWASQIKSPYIARTTLLPGDEILVVVEGQERLTGKRTVLPDGSIPQPLVGPIRAEGLTPAQVSETLRQKLLKFFQAPTVGVHLVEFRPLIVSATGEVETSGPLKLTEKRSLLEAISQAGGLTEFADRDSIYVVRRNPQLMRIRFRYEDLVTPNVPATRFHLRDGDVIVVE